ncbi:unnamed protein product [Pleuronectes platessa]|uniref:Uncharacterized protein n=1 Tax=Pleuronectes platessa TaxID=8262 RepID=A0A9N7UEA6_PLEPL|nr:unnamed protein product [Pleuronectes platessa]
MPFCGSWYEQVNLDLQSHSEDKVVVEETLGGQTDGDGRGQKQNPFRDVNKIKEPDMIKHEVHYKAAGLAAADWLLNYRGNHSDWQLRAQSNILAVRTQDR